MGIIMRVPPYAFLHVIQVQKWMSVYMCHNLSLLCIQTAEENSKACVKCQIGYSSSFQILIVILHYTTTGQEINTIIFLNILAGINLNCEPHNKYCLYTHYQPLLF